MGEKTDICTFGIIPKKHEIRYLLQHTFGSVTAQVVGHRISTIQCCFHVQAANEIFGVVLIEVKSHLGHICTVVQPALTELISGGAVL